jgi:hypothetical protein
MSLETLLHDLFIPKDAEIARDLLIKYDLKEVIERLIDRLKLLKNASSLPGISASVLTAINERVKSIVDDNEKQHVQMLLAQILVRLLKDVIIVSSSPHDELAKVTESLENTCSINNYDFQGLSKLLNLKDLKASLPSPKKSATYYYDWKGKARDLDQLATELKHRGTIVSVKEFKDLFHDHRNDMLQVKFARKDLTFLLALFEQLKDHKLIIPRGSKGHYQPLKAYGVDLDNTRLISKKTKTLKFVAKKSGAKWAEQIQIAGIFVKPYVSRR